MFGMMVTKLPHEILESASGVTCNNCNNPATHKVAEVLNDNSNRHEFNRYVCCDCNEESWNWLDENAPLFATAVSREVKAGRTPEQIRQYVMKNTQRAGIALRCQQAARYLQVVE